MRVHHSPSVVIFLFMTLKPAQFARMFANDPLGRKMPPLGGWLLYWHW